jgi:hypothetical protein
MNRVEICFKEACRYSPGGEKAVWCWVPMHCQVECVRAMSCRIEGWSRHGSVAVPTNRACGGAEHCMKARQVVVARRQDYREESAGALSWGEWGHCIGS